MRCLGQITSPANGTTKKYLRGSTANLTWTFDDEPSSLTSRNWFFIPDGGSKKGEKLASIIDGKIKYKNGSGLLGVKIERPATLLLHNVNQSYNGKYEFTIQANDKFHSSFVTVVITGEFYEVNTLFFKRGNLSIHACISAES